MNITQLKSTAMKCGIVSTEKSHLLLMLHNAVFQPKTITGIHAVIWKNLVSLIIDSLEEVPDQNADNYQ